MAWTWMTGVCEPLGNHFTTGPSSASQTNIDEYNGKAIRRIWHTTDRPYTQPGGARAHAQMLVAQGKFVIPTLFDGAGGNEFAAGTVGPASTPGTLLHDCTLFAAAMEGVCSVVELVNEVTPTNHHSGPPGAPFGGGKYWDFFRQASAIFAVRGIDVILSGVPNRLSFLDDANAENIWSYATGGIGIHPYWPNPGTNLTTTGTGLYFLKTARDKVDAFGALPTSLPFWVTEFGWVTKDPPPPGGPGGNLICNEATLSSRITQFHTGMVTYAETLKVAATCLFTWPDWTTSADDLAPFKYSGIRTNETGRYQTGPNGGSTADWDYRIGVQVAQDADTIKPTLAGTLPPNIPGTASGLLQHTPGSTIRYAQGIPTTNANLSANYTRDAAYCADFIAAGKRPLACLSIGRASTWYAWTNGASATADWTDLITAWVSKLYAVGVRDFEVGNEVEDPVEPYLTDYFDILDIASPIIKAKDPNNNVILTSTLGPGADQLAFLEETTARGKWGLVQGAAIHPYSTTAAGVPTKLTDARAAGRIPANKDIYITEMGMGSDNGGNAFSTTEAGQASFLTSVFNSLTTTFVTTNRIRLACMFVYANFNTAGDTLTPGPNTWGEYAGLRRANGNYKPAWDAAIAAGYGKGIAVPWYYKNGGGQNGAPTPTTGRTATAKEALDAFGEGTVGTGSAPVSVTGVADQVTQTTARLKGTVDPNSLSTTWFYEYSTEPLP